MLRILLVVVLLAVSNCVLARNERDDFIENLLKQMDNEDKCGQMTQVAYDLVKKSNADPLDPNPTDENKLKIALQDFKIGSILGTPNGIPYAKTWQNVIRTIQDFALTKTKHKIPIIYGVDSVHGANFIREAQLFPHQLSLAATFNTKLIEKIGQTVATETRAVGVPWNFSPVMDIGRHPLWPRLFETFGEDPVLAASIGAAYIKGHQGNDLKNRSNAATCLKHYIGYSYPFNGRDRSASWIPEILLRESFLPSFAKGVEVGSPSVMLNSGDVNGIPGHANYHYITEILKGELKFDGFTVSDWEDIIRLHVRDKVATSPEEAVRLAVMAGVDMSMVPLDFSFYNHCVSLSYKDEKFRNRIDDATRRILTVKKSLGLFDDPFPYAADLVKIGTKDSENLSLEAAREGIILAKNNNNILPLKKGSNIAVVGPSCKSLRILNGGWTYANENEYYEIFGTKKWTLVDAIANKSEGTIKYGEGVNFTHITNLSQTVELARTSDFIILCIGEDVYTETSGNIDNLMISQPQTTLFNNLANLNKPIISVYLGGRPRTITHIVEKAQAVILSFLPGPEGSKAIADVLFGDYNPNGRLPLSYPKGPNGYITYDFKPLEDFDYSFGDGIPYLFDALFPFGHGLSYTNFSYSNLVLQKTQIDPPETVFGSVKVKNIGSIEGKETVIVYLNDEYGSISRPHKQMKYFDKISLNAGEEKVVNFEITIKDMSFIDLNNKRIAEKGKFNVFVSNLTASFQLKSTFTLNN